MGRNECIHVCLCPERAMMSQIGNTSGLERTLRILMLNTPLCILADTPVK